MSVWSNDFGTTRDPARRWAYDKMLRNSADLRYIDRCMQPDTSEPFRLAAVRVVGPCRSPRVPQPALTVNHAYQRTTHLSRLSDGYAPGPPINARIGPRVPLRRRIDWWRVAGLALCALSAAIVIGGSFLLTWSLLSH